TRSRNSQRYTQRLSIQREGGSRITGRCRRVCDSSFLWTCPWGGCSEIVLTVRGYVGGWNELLLNFERRKQGDEASPVSLARFLVGNAHGCNDATTGQVLAAGHRSQSKRRIAGLPNAERCARGT